MAKFSLRCNFNRTVGQRLLEFRDLFLADLRAVEVKPLKVLQICQRGQVADLRAVEGKRFKVLQIRQWGQVADRRLA